MELAATPSAPKVTPDLEQYATVRLESLKNLLCAEPETRVALDSDGQGRVVADLTVAVRGYRTLKTRAKAPDAATAIDKAAKKLERRYKLFWARGSFRFGDCC